MIGIDLAALPDGFAVDLVLKATVLLCVTASVALVLPRASAAARHLVWTAGVVGLVSLPVLTLLVPPVEVPVGVIAEEPLLGWELAGPSPLPLPGEETGELRHALPPESWYPAEPAAASAVAASGGSDPIPWTRWILAVWAVGTAMLLFRLSLGWWGVRRLSRDAASVTDPRWTQLLKDATWLLGLEREVVLLRSARVRMPMTWGTLKPTVLLPEEAETWSDERRRVVVLHELAHVARHDCLTQTMADLACAIYWFHPLTWLAARRLRAERERACDDQVLGAGERASAYATHLLEVARAYRSVRPAGAAALAMARPSQLEGRLLAVLDSARSRRPPSRRARLATIAALTLLLLPLAAIRTVPAQAEPPTDDAFGEASELETGSEGADLVGAESQDRVIERDIAAQPGESVELRLGTGGEVRLTGWDRNVVSLRAVLRGTDADGTEVDLTRSGSGVTLSSERRSSLRNNDTHHSFELRVPFRSDVVVRSAGGELNIEGIRGTLSGSTGGGTIRLRNVAGQADLRTGGGEILVSDSELDGEVRTGGGDVRVVNSSGSLQTITGGGQVFVEQATARSAPGRDRGVDGEVFRYRTGGGDVHIAQAPWGADVTTGGGAIRIGSAGGDVRATTGGGPITVGSVDGKTNLSTGSGAVRIGPAAGQVEVSTGSGAVDVTLASGSGQQDVRISSGSGTVTLLLPADFEGEFDIETHGPADGRHRIDSDFPLRMEPTDGTTSRGGRLRATGRSGNGGNRVHIRTANGSVVIRRGATSASARSPDATVAASSRTRIVSGRQPAPTSPPRAIQLEERHQEEFERWVEVTVNSALSAAGQVLTEAQIGRIIADFAIRATQVGLAEARHALSVEERVEIEREIRHAVEASLSTTRPTPPAPPRQ